MQYTAALEMFRELDTLKVELCIFSHFYFILANCDVINFVHLQNVVTATFDGK